MEKGQIFQVPLSLIWCFTYTAREKLYQHTRGAKI
jgi:hypothetical protein